MRVSSAIDELKSVEDVKEFLKKSYVPLVDQVASIRSKYDKQLKGKLLSSITNSQQRVEGEGGGDGEGDGGAQENSGGAARKAAKSFADTGRLDETT